MHYIFFWDPKVWFLCLCFALNATPGKGHKSIWRKSSLSLALQILDFLNGNEHFGHFVLSEEKCEIQEHLKRPLSLTENFITSSFWVKLPQQRPNPKLSLELTFVLIHSFSQRVSVWLSVSYCPLDTCLETFVHHGLPDIEQLNQF